MSKFKFYVIAKFHYRTILCHAHRKSHHDGFEKQNNKHFLGLKWFISLHSETIVACSTNHIRFNLMSCFTRPDLVEKNHVGFLASKVEPKFVYNKCIYSWPLIMEA